MQQIQVGSDDAVVRHGRGQLVPHGFGHATDVHEILRHHGEPVLECVRGGGVDLLGNDPALIQVPLFILVDLVHGLREGVKRKQDQVRIVFNGHEGVDGAGHVCEQHVERRGEDEVAFAFIFIRSKRGHHGNVLLENPAAIELGSGHHVLDFFDAQAHVREHQDIQGIDLNAQRRQRHQVVGKRERSELERFPLVVGDVPDLITVIFGVGFPRDEQAVPVGCDFGPVPELFMNDGLFLGHAQAFQEMLKFLPALRAVQRRVRHVMGHVVNVRRHVEPFFQIFFGRLVQVPEKSLVGSRKVLAHGVSSGVSFVDRVFPYVLPNPLERDQGERAFCS